MAQPEQVKDLPQGDLEPAIPGGARAAVAQPEYRVIDPSKFPKDSKHPVVVVVDSFGGDDFGKRRIDIDGDVFRGKPTAGRELAHGEVISRLIESEVPEVTVVKLDWPVGHLAKDNSKGVRLFEELALLRKQGYRIDAVNLSMSPGATPARYSDIKRITGLDVSPEDLASRRAVISLKLMSWSIDNEGNDLEKQQTWNAFSTMSAMTMLVNSGVPLYLSAGNLGPDTFNLYSLANGVTSVAAVDARGVDSEYSAKHSLVQRQARGDYNVSQVKEGDVVVGLDFTGDGKVDIAASELSGKGVYVDPVIAQMSAKPLREVQASEEQIKHAASILKKRLNSPTMRNVGTLEALSYLTGKDSDLAKEKSLQGVLFPVEAILTALGRPAVEAKQAAIQLGEFVHPEQLFFRADDKGKVLYSPDGSKTAAVWKLWGTSLAAPKALCEDLLKKINK